MTHAVLIPNANGTSDLRLFADDPEQRPVTLFNLDYASLRAIFMVIQNAMTETAEDDSSPPELEFRNLVWIHGNTPPLAQLHSEGWHLVGWPEPMMHEDKQVRWYATMQREKP